MPPSPLARLRWTCALALVLACQGSSPDTAGNTEINLDVVNPGGTSGELGFSVDRVDYRVTCAGNPPGSYPIPGADTTGTDYNYDDSVDISGGFEIVDTRDPPVWQAVMDLPPGDCTITLSVWDGDEVVCIGSQTLAIAEDATTKYDIVLVCSLSVDTPGGMADVDGAFEFITGNVCPKLHVLNAIPSGAQTLQTCSFYRNPCVTEADCSYPNEICAAFTEVQYRAKDPDNTCGSNCDPQSCTTDNPPVCAPYPSNINDPNCNTAFGGDPNSAACLAGDFAGLVCTISAVPLATGVPGGTFLRPQDNVTPVGPVLPINLNTGSGLPGVILPGLGGPFDILDFVSDAPSNPIYPPLPNANGSLPPFLYRCDTTIPGQVQISVTCSDGDLECDQQKEIEILCTSAPNFCGQDPIDCSGSNECLTDGTCDPFCDPVDAANGLCDRCPGKDDPLPDGTLCSVGLCIDGVCDSSCPGIDEIVVSPLEADVGDTISVSAAASSQDGGPLDYSWTATAGSFADPNSAATTYLCTEVGQHSLTVTVSNATASCTDENTFTITCVSGP